MPTSDLPAYPSEDAVLSGVSAEMLKLLFPAAVEEITRKAGEQREAALLVGPGRGERHRGRAGPGQGGGRRVRRPRRRRTGCGRAGGTPAQWQALADAAAARGEIPWKSLESPPRPPMLPNFGQVRAWMMTPDRHRRASGRPPPPSTSSAQMQQELAEVKSTVDEPHARPARDRLQVGRRRRAPTRPRATGTTSRRSTSATPASARCARRGPSPC